MFLLLVLQLYISMKPNKPSRNKRKRAIFKYGYDKKLFHAYLVLRFLTNCLYSRSLFSSSLSTSHTGIFFSKEFLPEFSQAKLTLIVPCLFSIVEPTCMLALEKFLPSTATYCHIIPNVLLQFALLSSTYFPIVYLVLPLNIYYV